MSQYQRPLDENKVAKFGFFFESTFPGRDRRTTWNMVCGTFYPLYKGRVRRELFGALKRHNWTQARIWMGWFR